MKIVNLLAAGVLFSIPSFAQNFHTLQPVPIVNDNELEQVWNMTSLGDKLIIGGRLNTGRLFGPFLYYNGTDPVQTIPEDMMKGAKVSTVLSQIENVPKGTHYFNAWGDGKGGIYKWDGQSPVEKLVSYEANGSNFDDGVWLDNKIYFMRNPRQGDNKKESELWVFDVVQKTLKQLTQQDFRSSKVKAYKGKLYYFNSNSSEYLYCYAPLTQQTSTIPTGIHTSKGYFSVNYMQVLGGKLIFSLSEEEINGKELYEYNGNEVRMITDLAKGKHDGVGDISQPYNGKIYFSGNTDTKNEHGNFDLYSYDPVSEQVQLVKEFVKNNKSGGFPHRFYVGNNKLYFTAVGVESYKQVYEYDDATHEVTCLTNVPNDEKGKFYPLAYYYWRGKLYIAASSNTGMIPFGNERLYSIDLSDKPTAVNTAISTPQVKVYPNPTSGDTRIDIQLPRAAKISITLTDVSGKEVYEHHGMSTALNHSITIPMTQFASGNYIYTITNESGVLLSNGKLTKQ